MHDSLTNLIDTVRAGGLGTLKDWRAAEARWKESPGVSLVDVEAARTAEMPWRAEIATRGILCAEPRTCVTSLGIPLPFAKAGTARVLSRLTSRFLYSPLLTAPDLAGSDREDWFNLLDARGHYGANCEPWHVHSDIPVYIERGQLNLRALRERILLRPDQWGLLDAFLALLDTFPDEDLSDIVLPDLPAEAPARAYALQALLRILAGQHDSATLPMLLKQLIFEEQGEAFDFRKRLADLLQERSLPTNTTLSVLQAALDATPLPSPDVRDALLLTLLTALYRSTPAAFTTREAWSTFQLSEPYLPEQPPESPAPRLLRIDDLRNIRLFKEPPLVDQAFPKPTDEGGQWIVFVGENGVGKTTLLRAIALCLAPPDVAMRLLDERFPLLSNGAEGSVKLELDSGPLAIALRRNERGAEVLESTSPSNAKRPWVVAYGVRRGNAQGEKDRSPEVGQLGELHTLFDRPASLYNAVQWLKELDAEVMREQQRKSKAQRDHGRTGRSGVWRAVNIALKRLLGITKIEVVEGGLVLVEHPQFGRVRLDALSDGYLTTAGWVIDMIARFVERQRELDEPVGADLLKQMTGFVLIDEIDLHLHPVWQTQIVRKVRGLFPRLSFIVTTHNPLTLEGARPGEVYVMRRQGPRIEMVQKDIRPGQDVDRVLFEQFGVEHTFDKETRDLLERHVELIAHGAKPEDPERKVIEAKIAERFGTLGDTLQKERTDASGPVAPFSPEERDAFLEQMKKLPPRQG